MMKIGIVEQKGQRRRNQMQPGKRGIDHAVITQDNFPRENPQQITGPEWNRDKQQPDEFCFCAKCNEVGHRISQHNRNDAGGRGDGERAQEDHEIDFPGHHGAIFGKRQMRVDGETLLCPEAVKDEKCKRRSQRKCEQHGRRCQQQVTRK